jgi:hypothetical protein
LSRSVTAHCGRIRRFHLLSTGLAECKKASIPATTSNIEEKKKRKGEKSYDIASTDAWHRRVLSISVIDYGPFVTGIRRFAVTCESCE